MRARVTVYQDRKGTWRWRFTVNGRVMADSGEGYTRRRQAWRAWDQFRKYQTDTMQRYQEFSTDPKHSPRNPAAAAPGRGKE